MRSRFKNYLSTHENGWEEEELAFYLFEQVAGLALPTARELVHKAIAYNEGVDILSDGIAAGSVQIPASGTPIIMMADRQTTGGYAKIATVISADLQLMAQAAPGTRLRFVAVSEKEAVKLKKVDENRLKQMEYGFFSVR